MLGLARQSGLPSLLAPHRPRAVGKHHCVLGRKASALLAVTVVQNYSYGTFRNRFPKQLAISQVYLLDGNGQGFFFNRLSDVGCLNSGHFSSSNT